MKRVLKVIFLVTSLLVLYEIYSNYPRLNIISGYSAKIMNSSVFLAGRDFEFTDSHDNNFSLVNLATDKIDYKNKTTVASVYGLTSRKAVYHEGLGSVLMVDGFDQNEQFLVPHRTNKHINFPYPYGDLAQKDTSFNEIDYKELNKAVNNSFSNNEIKKTRALLVLYKDNIIAEKYAEGFDKDSKLLGWSMTKSITATIYGILQSQGKLNINDKAAVDSWKNDDRAAITINDLLHMNSGLAWDEDYDNISDVTKMLFLAEDMSKIQEEKELTGKTNESWNYSSGTTNLLSGLLKKQFNSQQEYLDFWYRSLIDKIGMHSMLIETDLSGNFVGSSYGWATPRDWAKFGLLYLHKGNWNGVQIFDKSWVDYVATPTNTSEGQYGAHFWLNAGGYYPDAPRDIFSANGFQGQRVFIIPSTEMVIVRMGLAGDDHFDFNQLLKEIVNSVHRKPISS